MPPMKPGTGLHGPLLLEEPLIRVSTGRLCEVEVLPPLGMTQVLASY